MDECKGIIGKLMGHDYEAVFDKEVPAASVAQLSNTGMIASWDMEKVVSRMAKTTYQGHVCRRCGNRVRRIERV